MKKCIEEILEIQGYFIQQMTKQKNKVIIDCLHQWQAIPLPHQSLTIKHRVHLREFLS